MQTGNQYEDFLAESRLAFDKGLPVDPITRNRLMQANAAAFQALVRPTPTPPAPLASAAPSRALPGLRRGGLRR